MKQELAKAIGKVLEYMWVDEETDYETFQEELKDELENIHKDHIFHSLKVLRDAHLEHQLEQELITLEGLKTRR